MPEVTRQRTGELLRGLFKILLDHPEGLQARDALRELAAKVPPTEHEKGIYKTGGRRYDFVVRFGTVDCVKAGWMVKSKGRWLVTDEGKRAWETYKEPDEFCRRAAHLYSQWRVGSRRAEGESAIEPGEH